MIKQQKKYQGPPTKKNKELMDIYNMGDEGTMLSKKQIDALIKEGKAVKKAAGGSVCGRPTGKGMGAARTRNY